jgi:hypothetical protein
MLIAETLRAAVMAAARMVVRFMELSPIVKMVDVQITQREGRAGERYFA